MTRTSHHFSDATAVQGLGAAESCPVDRALFDSFPASDPPSWVVSAGLARMAEDRTTTGDVPGEASHLEEPVLFFSSHATSLPALITLLRLGEPFWACRVGRDPQDAESFARIHPWSSLPLLRSEKGDLGGQLAVLKHLSLQGSEARLLPEPGTPERVRFLELFLHMERTLLPALQLASELDSADDRSEDQVVLADAKLIDALRRLDRQLEEGPYLLGSSYTVLDSLLFGLGRWAGRRLKLARCAPALDAYLKRLAGEREIRWALRILAELPLIEPIPNFLGSLPLASFDVGRRATAA